MSIANCGKLLCLDTAKNRGYKDIMNKKLTLKEKKFVKITAKTLSPAQAVRETYNIGSKGGVKDKQHRDNTVYAIASENLTKPHIKKSLEEAMQEKGIDNELIVSITNRNLKQDKNIPASNQVLDMIHKIKGNYALEKRVNLNINQMNIDNKIKDLQDELKQLQQEG